MTFEPNIVGFCCNWCSYAAADLAGVSRMNYPTNVRIIRVPCSGRIGEIQLLEALEAGADGVFISGCLPGECHHLTGNYYAKTRVEKLKKQLEEIGLGGRVEMYYASAAMAKEFTQYATEFTEQIRELGPSPLRD